MGGDGEPNPSLQPRTGRLRWPVAPALPDRRTGLPRNAGLPAGRSCRPKPEIITCRPKPDVL